MKAHVGVEASSGLAHTVIGKAGNVADVVWAHTLPHGDEFVTFGDACCHGVEKRPEHRQISDMACSHETLQTLGAAKNKLAPTESWRG